MKTNTIPTDTLSQDIAEDAYRIVEKLISHTCWKFQRRHGGEFEEWLSEANEIFMTAFRRHDSTRSAFITCLYTHLHWGLYDFLRKRKAESDRSAISFEQLYHNGYYHGRRDWEDLPAQELFAAPIQRSITTLVSHLSDSSRELYGLILDPPQELQGELDATEPEATWDAIRRYCEWSLRWTWKEMQTAIAELRELCSE